MHGRRRQAQKESTEAEKAQTRQQVERYCALNQQVMELKAASVFSTESLSATKRLLEQNTELHTVWNYRRTIFMHLDAWQNADERQQMLEQELNFMLEIIQKNIKSYWMWGHRVWTLSSLPRPEWKRELGLVAKLLALDARNYHGWNYRRFIVSQLKAVAADAHAVDESEFAFTTEQINRDCANHAAWHNRSKLLPSILAHKSESDQQQVLQTENDLIMNAIYTDPEDQNAWLYYDWLLDIQKSDDDRCRLLRNKITAIQELLELDEDSKRPLIELVSAYAELQRLAPDTISDIEKADCLDTLCKLKNIDPFRAGRYSDMSRTLGQQWALSV